MIQSCFSQPNTPSSKPSKDHHNHDHDHSDDESPKQSLITCIYQTTICDTTTYLTLTWSKTPFSHTLTLFAPDLFSLSLSLIPSSFSLFKPKPSNSKSIHLTHRHHYHKLKLLWDFSRADFTSAEPDSRFYLALTSVSGEIGLQFFLGDLADDFSRRAGADFSLAGPEPILISRREHAFAARSRSRYSSRAVVSGKRYEIGIEHSTSGSLKVRVDGELRLVVKRLTWKFRGNEKILFGKIEVEFFWDVFNWINGGDDRHGVFVFQIGENGGVWPEMIGPEKRLLKKSLSVDHVKSNNNNNNNGDYNNGNNLGSSTSALSHSSSCSSVLQWAEESSSECGSRSSCSSSTRSCGNGGFSLLIYAWKKY